MPIEQGSYHSPNGHGGEYRNHLRGRLAEIEAMKKDVESEMEKLENERKEAEQTGNMDAAARCRKDIERARRTMDSLSSSKDEIDRKLEED